MSYRAFGWIPSSESESDSETDSGLLCIENRSVILGPKLELNMPDVYDQGKIGSCTANAIANLIRYERLKKKSGITIMNRVECFYTTLLERIKT
jgi:hypothetical protein